LTKISDF